MIKQETKTGWSLEATYTGLPGLFYTRQKPEPVSNPKIIKHNAPLASSLGLDVRELDGQDGAAMLSGNVLPDGAQPIAQAYAGHQFGFFTMLGDGRAVLLGEQITPDGTRFDIQLKGSGITPYSRGGDGRAALGPMLREYIISEAMHGLGIPTTRSLAVVSTGESIYREEELQGAVLTRVASSHIRVGTFEYAAHFGTPEDVKFLADYTIRRHYPECRDTPNRYLSMLSAIVRRQAELIAKWQLVGFVHGVMNTDNMSVCGETIDYGPCAFMDSYAPKTVFSSIDRYGRYAYGNQPDIAVWNLSRLAETLLPLIDKDDQSAVSKAQDSVSLFWERFEGAWLSGMRANNPRTGK